MANTPVTPTATTLQTLEVLDSGGLTLASVPVIQAGGHEYGLNKQAFQAYGVDTQGAAGDGRLIPGTRTIDVLIESTSSAPANAALYDLLDALRTASALRLDGVTINLAGCGGITATQPLTGNRAGDLKATITYIPTTQAATNASGESVLGPL